MGLVQSRSQMVRLMTSEADEADCWIGRLLDWSIGGRVR